VDDLGILILDDELESQKALRHVLDAEGWKIHVVPLGSQALIEIASGKWTLVIANVALTDLHGPVFTTLKELAQASFDSNTPAGEPGAEGRRQIRVLFLVPALAAKETVPTLEREGLPYSLKPYHLHDFLEKISDLLLEAGAIPSPIRSVNLGLSGSQRRQKERRAGRERRRTTMFASREDYQMTEEEINEYERHEEEERKKKEKEKEKKEPEFL
jgi:CheY-like chemotaxis protein